MRIVSFDAFRTLDIPGVTYIKPENYQAHLELLQKSDWLLFPEYWQVNSLFYGLGCRIFPSIASYHLGYDKVETTRALQLVCPDNLPQTEIYANTPESVRSILQRFSFPFVAKIPRSSEGRGVFLIENKDDWNAYQCNQTVLYVQEYLPIDCDLRVVVIGRKVVASYWRLQSADGFHNNLAAGGTIDFSPAPEQALALIKEIACRLNINHAAFDVALVNGQPYIFEFNRLFGNRGLVEQNIKPATLIYAYLLSLQSPGKTPATGKGRRKTKWRKAG
ncbi:MAG: ATP-grasp domain-containing protein [Gammaproteobacteria bacterium]|nr:ATP-grasp domain-containing protein [Gammaproteobacteria bacterium]